MIKIIDIIITSLQVRLSFKQKNAKSFPPRLSVQTEKKVRLGYLE